MNICLLLTVYWKDENKEKEAGNGPFLKKLRLANKSKEQLDFSVFGIPTLATVNKYEII